MAWHYNPASYLVMAFGVLGVARTILGVTTRRWLSVSLKVSRLGWGVVVLAFLAFWAYQQSNAEFIIHAQI